MCRCPFPGRWTVGGELRAADRGRDESTGGGGVWWTQRGDRLTRGGGEDKWRERGGIEMRFRQDFG